MIHLLIHIAELWISCNHSRKRTCCYWGQLYENICSVHSSDQDTKKKMSSCIKRGLWYKAGSIVMPWLCMVCIHLEHCAQLLSPYFMSNLLEIESIQKKKKAQLWNQWLGNFLDKGKVEISNKHMIWKLSFALVGYTLRTWPLLKRQIDINQFFCN